jgi:trimeric autotransporter adhesin
MCGACIGFHHLPNRQELLVSFIQFSSWKQPSKESLFLVLQEDNMKIKRSLISLLITVVLLIMTAGLAIGQETRSTILGTGFTYQGQLIASGDPYSGTCDFLFGLYDAETSGTGGGMIGMYYVPVNNGLFTVQLDFGENVFQGDARWLEISVRCPAESGTYTLLAPRQSITPVPYALVLPGLRTQQNTTSPNIIGGYVGNWVANDVVGATIGGGGDSGYENVVKDDYGTVSGGVGNQAGDDTSFAATYATVGGGYENTASGQYTTIGGGSSNTASGTYSTIGGGYYNGASGTYSTIGGGYHNGASGYASTVGGGFGNTASGYYSTIGGGYDNEASVHGSTVAGGNSNVASGNYSTVGGGDVNSASGYRSTLAGGSTNVASGDYSMVGGGYYNNAIGLSSAIGGGSNHDASGESSTVGGGYDNEASGYRSTIAGGYSNLASGDYSTVGGGYDNTASGIRSTVPGGVYNVAYGYTSFAAGTRAIANGQGCFVWGDSTNAEVICNTVDQFKARASGGFVFYTNSGMSSGAHLSSGGGSWSSLSDRNMKENFETVDTQALLETLAQVEITTWNYISQEDSIRHIGPMAQDFYAAFGVGEDQTHITSIDSDGVALAAIQGLYAENQELKAQVNDLESRLTALEGAITASNPDQMRVGTPFHWVFGFGLCFVGGTWVIHRRKEGEL